MEMGRQHRKGKERRHTCSVNRDSPAGRLEMTLERQTGMCHRERAVSW